MALNTEIQTTYHYVDEYGMMVVQGDDRSWRDSIGRNVLCLFTYGWDVTLIAGLEDCFKPAPGEWKLKRHPQHPESDISRDHWSYMIMYRALFSTKEEFEIFIDQIPRMSGLYYWMYALAGSKFDELRYYAIQIPGAWLGNIWNKVIRAIRARELLIPTYSLHNKAWQVHFMPDSKAKKRLQRILLKRLPKGNTNYLLTLLFGGYVSKADIDSYRHMTNYRWGVLLDWTTSRDVHVIEDPKLLEYNAYEVDLLKTVYDGKI